MYLHSVVLLQPPPLYNVARPGRFAAADNASGQRGTPTPGGAAHVQIVRSRREGRAIGVCRERGDGSRRGGGRGGGGTQVSKIARSVRRAAGTRYSNLSSEHMGTNATTTTTVPYQHQDCKGRIKVELNTDNAVLITGATGRPSTGARKLARGLSRRDSPSEARKPRRDYRGGAAGEEGRGGHGTGDLYSPWSIQWVVVVLVMVTEIFFCSFLCSSIF